MFRRTRKYLQGCIRAIGAFHVDAHEVVHIPRLPHNGLNVLPAQFRIDGESELSQLQRHVAVGFRPAERIQPFEVFLVATDASSLVVIGYSEGSRVWR